MNRTLPQIIVVDQQGCVIDEGINPALASLVPLIIEQVSQTDVATPGSAPSFPFSVLCSGQCNLLMLRGDHLPLLK